MLYLTTRRAIMNKFRKILGRISAEICLKMDNFGSKSPKLPSANPPFRLKTRECKTLLPLRLLVDANDWQFESKTKLIFYIFCPLFKKLSLALGLGAPYSLPRPSCIQRLEAFPADSDSLGLCQMDPRINFSSPLIIFSAAAYNV